MKINCSKKRKISFILSAIMTFGILFNGIQMKKVSAEANNLIVNGDAEKWTGDKVSNWNGKWENASKGTVVHGGEASIKHTSKSSTTDLSTSITGVEPGKEYTVSFWYNDSDNNARVRPWMSWRAEDGSEISISGENVLRPDYLPQEDKWVKWEVKAVAPSNAASFNYEIRVYREADKTHGGSVYYDDLYFGVGGEQIPETKVSNVLTNVTPGKVLKGTAVELSTVTTGSAIYYKIGTEALTTTEGAIQYTGPITVNEDMEVHAVGVKEGLENSEESIFNYIVLTEDSYDKIYDIQGEGHRSSKVGETVNVVGVVTAVSNDKYDAGIYIQDATGDGNDRTSDGIFVRGSGIQAKVGDKVLVEGRVTEKFKYPASDKDDQGHLSITEITKFNVTVMESGVAVPAPVVLGEGGRALITDIVDNDGFTTFDPTEDAIDFYESLEGMLVKINEPHIVQVEERYGTFNVLADNGRASASKLNPRGGIKITKENINPEILRIDDVVTPVTGSDKVFMDSRFNLAKTGDDFAGSIVGVMDYNFGAFKIYNTGKLPDIVAGINKRETTTIEFDEDKLTVAVYNVENFAADPEQTSDEKVERIANSIINELGTPDILSLVEVQDNNGPKKDGDSEANESYERLIDKIVEAGGPRYAYTDIAPVMNQDGGQPGGNIRVGFIYREDRVDFTGTKGGALEAAVMDGMHLAKNPSRIDPENPNFSNTRKSLVGEFQFKGESVFVIGNHLSSKRGDGPDFGSQQPPVKGSEPRRHEQAKAVNTFVKEILAANPMASIVVLGDMNDYEYSQTLEVLKGDELVNMIDKLPLNERYSYIYGGNLQVLDNLLVSKAIENTSVVDVVHVNAEFTEHSGRASDHDPVVVQISGLGAMDSVNFSKEAGFVMKGESLTLSTENGEGTILYTIGSSDEEAGNPVESGKEYKDPILLDMKGNVVVRAVVKKDGKFSAVKTMKYYVDIADLKVTPTEKEQFIGTVVKASAEGAEVLYTLEDTEDVSVYVPFPTEGVTVNEDVTISFVAKKGEEYSNILKKQYVAVPDILLSNISDIKVKDNGERVRFKGIISTRIGNNIFVQDETAGLYVYAGWQAREEFVVGNEVDIVATLSEYNDLKQVKSVEYVRVLSEGNGRPAGEVVTPSQIDESREGKLVRVENVVLTDVPSEKTNSYTMTGMSNGESVQIRIDKYSKPVNSENYKVGMMVDVIAPVGQYKSNYQLMVSEPEDIVIIPVGISNLKTQKVTFDENGSLVFEDNNALKRGETLNISAEIMPIEDMNAVVILRVVDSNNVVHLLNFDEKELKVNEKNNFNLGTSLKMFDYGTYRAQLYVWESISSQKVLSKVTEVEFTVK